MSSFILTNLLYFLEPLCPFSASFYILLLYISIHKEINSLPFLFVLLLLSFNWSFGFFLYTGGYSYIYMRVIMPPAHDNEEPFGFRGGTTWRDARTWRDKRIVWKLKVWGCLRIPWDYSYYYAKIKVKFIWIILKKTLDTWANLCKMATIKTR